MASIVGRLFLCAVAASVACCAVLAQELSKDDDERNRATIRDVPRLDLLLRLDELEETLQIQIRTDIELKLRQAGIQLGRIAATESDRLGLVVTNLSKGPHLPRLVVYADRCVTVPNGKFFMGSSIAVEQGVVLVINPKIGLPFMVTWRAEFNEFRERCDPRSEIRDLADQFVNAWLSVNRNTP